MALELLSLENLSEDETLASQIIFAFGSYTAGLKTLIDVMDDDIINDLTDADFKSKVVAAKELLSKADTCVDSASVFDPLPDEINGFPQLWRDLFEDFKTHMHHFIKDFAGVTEEFVANHCVGRNILLVDGQSGAVISAVKSGYSEQDMLKIPESIFNKAERCRNVFEETIGAYTSTILGFCASKIAGEDFSLFFRERIHAYYNWHLIRFEDFSQAFLHFGHPEAAAKLLYHIDVMSAVSE